MSATITPMSIYKLMSERQLADALADLERMVDQLQYARGPVAGKLTDAYADALLMARNEMERRRC
jgi:hypothetical protein